MTIFSKLNCTILVMVSLYSFSLHAMAAPIAADTYIDILKDKVKNFGSSPAVSVNDGNKALLKFSLSNLPSDTEESDINKATLFIYIKKVYVPGKLQVKQLGNNWVENVVTSNSVPHSLGLYTVSTANIWQRETYFAIDVTSLVKDWVSNQKSNYGLIIEPSVLSPNTSVIFDSKESAQTSHSPYIDIVFNHGIKGDQGIQGEKGGVGLTGATGLQGLKGDQGIQGEKGDVGLTGATGLQGLKGDQGIQGEKGGVGLTGATGLQGLKGDQGIQGEKGSVGLTGATGLQGLKGDQGIQGEKGIQGDKGDVGLTGSTGPQGLKGEQGDIGLIGTIGPQGAIIMWNGAIDKIPSGWALCDGTNGTPDLRDRFIVGAGRTYPVGATGGSPTLSIANHIHEITAESPGTNYVGDHSHHMDVAITECVGDCVDGAGDGSKSVGSDSHQHHFIADTWGAGGHSHTVNAHNHGGATGYSGGGTFDILPPFYSLVFIMKL